MKSANLNFLDPLGHSRPVTGLLYLYLNVEGILPKYTRTHTRVCICRHAIPSECMYKYIMLFTVQHLAIYSSTNLGFTLFCDISLPFLAVLLFSSTGRFSQAVWRGWWDWDCMEFYLHSTHSTRRILIYIFMCIEGLGEYVEVNVVVLIRTNRKMEGE